METKQNKQEELMQRITKLQVLSSLVGRMNLASKLGLDSFDGARNLYNALGYPTELGYTDYYNRYIRQDLAKAIIDKPVKASWKGGWSVSVQDTPDNTPFENAVIQLQKDFKLQNTFTRLDKLTGIGKYAVLVLGTNDITLKTDWAKPLQKSKKIKLMYLRPYSELNAKIGELEDNASDARYGLPKTYLIGDKQIPIHWSRVIHVVDEVLEDEVYGIPRLKAIYNRLMDVEKISGGDAEMFWRGARPGYTGKVDKDYELTTEMQEDLEKQLDEYENNLRRILVNEGIDYKALQQQVADPLNHIDIQLQLISAETNIPKRILVGSERGELSSGQDAIEWKEYIQYRRLNFVNDKILRPFLDKCIEYGILIKPEKAVWEIVWEDLFALSEKDRVDIGKTRADALKSYTGSPMAETVVPPDAFLKFFLGLSDEQLNQIELDKQAEVSKLPMEGDLPLPKGKKTNGAK